MERKGTEKKQNEKRKETGARQGNEEEERSGNRKGTEAEL